MVKKSVLSRKKLLGAIITSLLLLFCLEPLYLDTTYVFAGDFPSPKPYVHPYSVLSANTTFELVVTQLEQTYPVWFFFNLNSRNLAINTTIKFEVISPPNETNGIGIINYSLVYPNSTIYNQDNYNVSWYDFYYSPLIYPDWEGWKQYFSAWKNNNVTEQHYIAYKEYNYTIRETDKYFGISTNLKPTIKSYTDYCDRYEFIQVIWYEKSTGILVYKYWYSNFTRTYHYQRPPFIDVFLVEVYRPGFVLPKFTTDKSMSRTSNLGFLFGDSFIIPGLAFLSTTIIVVMRRKKRIF